VPRSKAWKKKCSYFILLILLLIRILALKRKKFKKNIVEVCSHICRPCCCISSVLWRGNESTLVLTEFTQKQRLHYWLMIRSFPPFPEVNFGTLPEIYWLIHFLRVVSSELHLPWWKLLPPPTHCASCVDSYPSVAPTAMLQWVIMKVKLSLCLSNYALRYEGVRRSGCP
jgi:hypothetical protein